MEVMVDAFAYSPSIFFFRHTRSAKRSKCVSDIFKMLVINDEGLYVIMCLAFPK